MAEIKAGALPSLPTGLSVADPDEKAKYNESIQKVLSAFENRSQIPWFKMAAAFADPGRSGSAAEGFGRAMGVLGQEQEQDRARALPVAQMRAQLAGQQYEMSKEEKALGAFANALGTTPQNLQSGMVGAANNPAMMQRLNAAMPLFYGSPKIMEMAKTLFGQHNDLSKLLLEERKAGTTEAELIMKYGAEILPMIRGGGTAPVTSGAPSGSPNTAPPSSGATAPAPNQPNLRPDQIMAVEDPEPVIDRSIGTVPPEAREIPAAPIRTATEAMGSLRVLPDRIEFPDGRPPLLRGSTPTESWNKTVQDERQAFTRQREDQIKFERERISSAGDARNASVAEKVKEVGSINPDDLNRSQGMLESFRELMKDPQMASSVGLMMKQGAGTAMYALAKDGLRIGNFGLSVDVYNSAIKGLPPEAQEKLRMAEMLLSDLFIQKAREAKSAFGPQISNFDILMQKERMASIRDTPKIINNWLTQEMTVADQKKEISDAYTNFLEQSEGTNRKPSQFFNSKEYKDISKKYGQIYKDLAIISYGAPR